VNFGIILSLLLSVAPLPMALERQGDTAFPTIHIVNLKGRALEYQFPLVWTVKTEVLADKFDLIFGQVQCLSEEVSGSFVLGKAKEGKVLKVEHEKQNLVKNGKTQLSKAVEKELPLSDYSAEGWEGAYYCLTDNSSILPAGEFRYIYAGFLIKSRHLCQFELLSNSKDKGNIEKLLQALSGLKMNWGGQP
jgi:hypothetical protein